MRGLSHWYCAYSGKPRPGYKILLDGLRAARFGAVIVWREDRLYRRLPDLLPFLDTVREASVEVEVVKAGRWDLATADGRHRVKQAALAAEYEAERMGERIRAGMQDLAADGRFHGGQRPYGYDKHGVTVVQQEADRVREAAARLLAGESAVAVCRDWNARGVPAPRGGLWRAKTLQGILGNPRYAGLRVHSGEVVGEARWASILDRATHERLAALLASRRAAPRGRPVTSLLAGMLVCGRDGCEGRLCSSTDRGQRRYGCFAAPGQPGCGRLSVIAGPLEDEVRDRVLSALASGRLARLLAEATRGDEQAARALDELRGIEQRREELARAYGAGTFTLAEWLAARDELDGRQKALEGRLRRDERARTLAGLPADYDALRSAWDGWGTDRRRALLRAAVDRVIVHPAARKGGRFDPDRVKLVWRG